MTKIGIEYRYRSRRDSGRGGQSIRRGYYHCKEKLIEQKVDRMVFNVANSVASQGMSGLDAVKNTPMVRVQNESVSIVGKGGVSIMVNDRMLNLSGSELTNYLQSLRSDDIARIEVITTPPAKYEAQGNSGIINIILKKS